MATYTPAAFPRRSKHDSLYSETKYQIQLAYYRYEINTGQYVMSPGEKIAYNMIVFMLLGLLFSAIYFSLPRSTITGLQRLAYYFTGSHQRLKMDVMSSVASVVSSNGEAVASLEGVGGLSAKANATAFAV